MRPHKALHAALPLVCAIAFAARAASSGPPPPPPPPPPQEAPLYSGLGHFEARLQTVEDDLVARLYERTLRARFPADASGDAMVRTLLQAAQVRSGEPAYRHASIETGEFAGNWEFIASGGGLPTRAWRDIDRSGETGYDVERIGYCRGGDDACGAWFASGRHRAPRPRLASGDRAEAEWINRVMQEPCDRQAEYRPSLAPLQAAVARAYLAPTDVALRLLHNPCGEVRDVGILQGSRNRDVDRALMTWARKAVLPEAVRDSGGRGAVSLLPFRLYAENADAVPQAPATPSP
jgi:hypothetical protein